MPGKLSEILGEHRPDTLEDEIAPVVGAPAAAVSKSLAQLGDHSCGVASHGRMAADEHRLLASQK
jgi:hypothetical protein